MNDTPKRYIAQIDVMPDSIQVTDSLGIVSHWHKELIDDIKVGNRLYNKGEVPDETDPQWRRVTL